LRNRERRHLAELAVILQTTLLLSLSNLFMLFAWYAHLKNLAGRPWYVAALASWSVALFEYLLQVPANRIGHSRFSIGPLKILQEAIAPTAFVPLAIVWPLPGGAVYLAFRP